MHPAEGLRLLTTGYAAALGPGTRHRGGCCPAWLSGRRSTSAARTVRRCPARNLVRWPGPSVRPARPARPARPGCQCLAGLVVAGRLRRAGGRRPARSPARARQAAASAGRWPAAPAEVRHV